MEEGEMGLWELGREVLRWERSEIGEEGEPRFMEGRVHQREPDLRRNRTRLSSSWVSLLSSSPALSRCRSSVWISLVGVDLSSRRHRC